MNIVERIWLWIRGYRLLASHEGVMPGDEWYDCGFLSSRGWTACNGAWGDGKFPYRQSEGTLYRRRLSMPALPPCLNSERPCVGCGHPVSRQLATVEREGWWHQECADKSWGDSEHGSLEVVAPFREVWKAAKL